MYWFTADEHHNHARILVYCNRPFANVDEMNTVLIKNHNSVVKKNDITIHCGDFCFGKPCDAQKIIKQLNGNHIFLKGSHDRWLPENHRTMWRKHIDGQFVVACHYAMRTWERAHYGAWNAFGHSHGQLNPIGKQWDVGVDHNDFMPVSFVQLKEIMDKLPMCQEHAIELYRHEDSFDEFLKEASKIVATWPMWKQDACRRALAPKRDSYE